MTEPQPTSSPLPAVRIVRGEPNEIELAALVAGLAATVPGEHDPATDTPVGRWADRSRLLPGATTPVGPDSWRWSLRG